METKFTKGKWEVVEHSWSDTSIVSDNKTIASISIYDEATEETQEELETEALANAKLIAAAPELLETLKELLEASNNFLAAHGADIYEHHSPIIIKSVKVIEKATE